jgi:LeuA allosteric (dimerisation) domain
LFGTQHQNMTNSANQKRLRFDHVTVTREPDGRCRAQVTIAFGERVIKCYAIDEADGVGPLKAAAVATLRAIEEAAKRRFSSSLADLDHVNALGKDLIAVLVDIKFEGREVQVFGSCQKAGDDIDAAVKAALNATNRFFELSMRT